LFIGLSDFSKKFTSPKNMSFISIDEITSSDHITESKRLPFEDNSHDVIIILHALDYTDNPYELVREIDRIATDEAKVAVIGFNKFSIWGILKPFMNKLSPPWILNFHSVYSVKEWFKLLGYEQDYKDTSSFFPIPSKTFSRHLNKISFIQKIMARDLGGLYFFAFKKKIIPLTPVKLKFKNKLFLSSFPKSTTNMVK
jgi:SAM-dependent methyltransferase